MRKLAQQDKELELRKRELELRQLEKDAFSRQQQIEERKINHGLKVWIEKERANLDEFDYEEIEMDLASFKRSHKTLSKRIRLSKYIFYNFWKLLGSNSEILLIG